MEKSDIRGQSPRQSFTEQGVGPQGSIMAYERDGARRATGNCAGRKWQGWGHCANEKKKVRVLFSSKFQREIKFSVILSKVSLICKVEYFPQRGRSVSRKLGLTTFSSWDARSYSFCTSVTLLAMERGRGLQKWHLLHFCPSTQSVIIEQSFWNFYCFRDLYLNERKTENTKTPGLTRCV